MTGHGGWPMTVFMAPDGRPFFGGTYFPRQRAAGCRPSSRSAVPSTSTGGPTASALEEQAGRLTAAIGQLSRLSPSSDLPEREGLDRRGSARSSANHDPRWGGFGQAPKFPQPMSIDAAAAPSRPHRRRRRARGGPHLARRHGRGRHLRPPRRRLRPLLHRRPLARAALREDALRQRAADPGVHPRLAAVGRGALPPGRRGDRGLRAARPRPPFRRLLLGRGRRQRGRGGSLLRLVRGARSPRLAVRRAWSGTA